MWPCSSMLRMLLRGLCLSIALFRPCGSDCCAVKISAGRLLGVSGLYMILAVLQQQADLVALLCCDRPHSPSQDMRGVIMWL